MWGAEGSGHAGFRSAGIAPDGAVRVRLDPYLTVVVRPPTLVQLGASADGARVLHPPSWLGSDTAATLLRWLQRFRTDAEVYRRAADAGLTEADACGLLTRLAEHDLLEWDVPAPSPVIRLHGQGPVTDALHDELLERGGLTVTAGADRQWAPSGGRLDLVLLTDALAPDPLLVHRLMRGHVAHLPVRLRDGTGIVGPLVLPGRSTCLRCMDRTRTDSDPAWPTLACQLYGRSGRAPGAVLRITVAVAAREVERAVATGSTPPPDSLGGTVEIAGCDIAVRRWPVHPGCGCVAIRPAGTST